MPEVTKVLCTNAEIYQITSTHEHIHMKTTVLTASMVYHKAYLNLTSV